MKDYYLEGKAIPQISIQAVQASGRSVTVTVEIHATIHDLGKSIGAALKLGAPDSPAVSLLHNGKELAGQDRVCDCGISEGETVNVVLREAAPTSVARASKMCNWRDHDLDHGEFR